MGAICVKSTEAYQLSQKLDEDLKKEAIQRSKEVKLLLLGITFFVNKTEKKLGAGESGKSTLFKQMKIIHHNGYSKDECLVYKDIIRSNILQSMKSLVTASQKLGISLEEQNKEMAAKVNELDQEALLNISQIYNQQLGKELALLWKDSGIQKTYTKRNQFQLLDSTE